LGASAALLTLYIEKNQKSENFGFRNKPLFPAKKAVSKLPLKKFIVVSKEIKEYKRLLEYGRKKSEGEKISMERSEIVKEVIDVEKETVEEEKKREEKSVLLDGGGDVNETVSNRKEDTFVTVADPRLRRMEKEKDKIKMENKNGVGHEAEKSIEKEGENEVERKNVQNVLRGIKAENLIQLGNVNMLDTLNIRKQKRKREENKSVISDKEVDERNQKAAIENKKEEKLSVSDIEKRRKD
jgi:hypothetical protein